MNESDVPAPTIIGITPGVNIHKRVNGHIVNIPQPMGIHFHFGSVRTYTQYPTAQHGQLFSIAICGVVESEVAHGYVYPPVYTHLNAVGSMICPSLRQIFGIAQILY